MVKNNNKASTKGLGQAIINSRDRNAKAHRSKKSEKGGNPMIPMVNEASAASALMSKTEETALEDFLATAQLAGIDFEAEKMDTKFVVSKTELVGIVTQSQQLQIKSMQSEYADQIRIPRRPPWDSETTASVLVNLENDAFLEWRKGLAELQKNEHIVLTPFEKNLELWRQLWRVLERSDVVVQIVDGRNPLLFRCPDLELLVRELGDDKVCVLLVNKADLLSKAQRKVWASYFQLLKVPVAFWSAIDEKERKKKKLKVLDEEEEEEEEPNSESEDNKPASAASSENGEEDDECANEDDDDEDWVSDSDDNDTEEELSGDRKSSFKNSTNVLDCDELVKFLRSLSCHKNDDAELTIGMVGYPNVGKSSTINKLIGMKKVRVSATPGKTKHFQTHYLEDNLVLCDCPGLVMPSMAFNREEMLLYGILPIDQLRGNPYPPVNLLCYWIGRSVLEKIYGVVIPKPGVEEDPTREPTAHEFLTSYAYLRGFMGSSGNPDVSRAARVVLKDFVNGKLVFSQPPPGCDLLDFNRALGNDPESLIVPVDPTVVVKESQQIKILRQRKLIVDHGDIDGSFFNEKHVNMHQKGNKGRQLVGADDGGSTLQLNGKSWRKHNNKNKKEKLRRIYGVNDA